VLTSKNLDLFLGPNRILFVTFHGVQWSIGALEIIWRKMKCALLSGRKVIDTTIHVPKERA
jgi:hypothetical protein